MKEFELKYGCNPNQKPAKIYMADGSDLPVTILNQLGKYVVVLQREGREPQFLSGTEAQGQVMPPGIR